jgi:hypothetical protein
MLELQLSNVQHRTLAVAEGLLIYFKEYKAGYDVFRWRLADSSAATVFAPTPLEY